MDIRSVDAASGAAQPSARPAQPNAAARPAEAAPPAAAGSTPAQLDKAVEELNKAMQTISPGLEFSVEKDTHQTVVKVVDQNTREVLRQIPTEETLEISKALGKLQGLLIKSQA